MQYLVRIGVIGVGTFCYYKLKSKSNELKLNTSLFDSRQFKITPEFLRALRSSDILHFKIQIKTDLGHLKDLEIHVKFNMAYRSTFTFDTLNEEVAIVTAEGSCQEILKLLDLSYVKAVDELNEAAGVTTAAAHGTSVHAHCN